MKSLKKMIALVIALVMCLSTFIPAMAEGETTTTVPDYNKLVATANDYNADYNYYTKDENGNYQTKEIADADALAEAIALGTVYYDVPGSITIKSPVVGATYKAYKVFDMTMDDKFQSYSYTIDTDSPWYGWVSSYASDPANGLMLSEIKSETVMDTSVDPAVPSYQKFNISAVTEANKIAVPGSDPVTYYDVFDAQDFGQYLQEKIEANNDPENANYNKVAIPNPKDPEYEMVPDTSAGAEAGATVSAGKVTVATSDEITFKDLPYGYYLILSGYPKAQLDKITVNDPNGNTANNFEFTVDELAGVYVETTGEGESATQTVVTPDSLTQKVETFVNNAVTTEYINTKIAEANNKTPKGAVNAAGDPITPADPEYQKFVDELKLSLRDDTLKQIYNVKSTVDAHNSDINVQKQRLVFVDSTTPNVDVAEKNEIDKWDIPLNPDGSADIENIPEHGEPDGGKNIILGYVQVDDDGNPVADAELLKEEPTDGTKTKPVYADWTEANIGDKITYEIRVNAMNYVRDENYQAGDDLANEKTFENDTKVHQVQEYIIADFQNDALEFDHSELSNGVVTGKDTIKVYLYDHDGNPVLDKDTNEPIVWDYTDLYDHFFIPAQVEVDKKDATTGEVVTDDQGNAVKETKETSASNILANGGGIVIPWVGVTDDPDVAKNYKNVTVNEEPVWKESSQTFNASAPLDEDGYVTDVNNNRITEKYEGITCWIKKVTVDGATKYYLFDASTGKQVPELVEEIKNGERVQDGYVTDAQGNTIYTYSDNDGNELVPVEVTEGDMTVIKYTTPDNVVNGIVQDNTKLLASANRTPVPAYKKVPKTTPHYVYSLYDSDVTIVVRYTMSLTKKATIDGLGNVNYSQYGLNYVDTDLYEYDNKQPGDQDYAKPKDIPESPDKDSEVDNATVYTYALAIQKVDETGKELAGATFKIKGITEEKIADGFYKVLSYDADAADSSELIADKNGLLVVEGLMESIELTVTEAKAPNGYNLLTESETMKATRVGKEIKTTATTTYLDKDGKETTKKEASTRITVYTNADGGAQLAKKVLNEDGTVSYYDANDNKLEDDAATVTNGKTAEEKFNALIDGKELADSNADVTSADLEPYAIKVVNKQGAELPSTGGIGTTIFYIGGAILVLAAGILLVSKRRMA